jgi:hypothetical protein
VENLRKQKSILMAFRPKQCEAYAPTVISTGAMLCIAEWRNLPTYTLYPTPVTPAPDNFTLCHSERNEVKELDLSEVEWEESQN